MLHQYPVKILYFKPKKQSHDSVPPTIERALLPKASLVKIFSNPFSPATYMGSACWEPHDFVVMIVMNGYHHSIKSVIFLACFTCM